MLDLSTALAGSLPVSIATSNVTLTGAAPASRFVLRGVDAVAAAGAAFGFAIPTKPCTSAMAGDRSALWLGPDEWLLLAPEAETAALYQGLSVALEGTACALVDVSHRQTALLIDGLKAAAILNACVPLDLSLKAFPVGMVTRTIFEKAEIVLWRTGPQAFRVEVWRSFAPYVLALLQAADRDVP
ncbi:sarcosine oxidase subunit gamma [Devosia sp.]|uniref:sarcosine oxidase subunit gamma n=1 Tax=Devosia sp. TaxID=1871048 RepID=UPI002FC96946